VLRGSASPRRAPSAIDIQSLTFEVRALGEKTRLQTRTESKPQLVEQINVCLHSGDYSRALDLLRGTAAEFPNDAELSELEKLAQ
jgi:hypothetical protein